MSKAIARRAGPAHLLEIAGCSGHSDQVEARFPSDWPSCCPPADAEPAAGTLYRILAHQPPSEDDFRSHRELGKLPHAEPCQRCGMSVFRERTHAIHQQRLFPRLGRFLARGSLSGHHGCTKLTPGKFPSPRPGGLAKASLVRHPLIR